MAKSYGLLVEGYDYANVPEAEFDDWYEREHIPAMTRVNGVLSANRWFNAEELSGMPGLGGAGGSRIAVAVYDLQTPDVLNSPAYRAVEDRRPPQVRHMLAACPVVCRFEAEQTLPGRQSSPPDAKGVMMFAMNVLPEVEAEFNAWFDDEHIPNLAAVPGVLAARRFRMPRGGSHRYLVLYHLATPHVQATPEWRKGGASQWTDRMKPHFLAPERNPLRLVLRPRAASG